MESLERDSSDLISSAEANGGSKILFICVYKFVHSNTNLIVTEFFMEGGKFDFCFV